MRRLTKEQMDSRESALEAALEHWLPVMLDWKWGEGKIRECLLLLARYCDSQAAKYFHQEKAYGHAKWQAERYMERAALIREAAEACK